jgi:hypothetical protein
MSRKKPTKPNWEMTLDELREATKAFDQEFVVDKSRPLTREERALWEEIRAQPPDESGGSGQRTIAVRLDKALLDPCTALAKKQRISRDALIARGLKALLAAAQTMDSKPAPIRRRPGKFKVGDWVRLLHGWGGALAEVVEDRGNLGVGGRRLYSVRFKLDEWNEMTTTYPEDELEPAPE